MHAMRARVALLAMVLLMCWAGPALAEHGGCHPYPECDGGATAPLVPDRVLYCFDDWWWDDYYQGWWAHESGLYRCPYPPSSWVWYGDWG